MGHALTVRWFGLNAALVHCVMVLRRQTLIWCRSCLGHCGDGACGMGLEIAFFMRSWGCERTERGFLCRLGSWRSRCSLAAVWGQEKKSSQQAKSFEKEITITVKLNYLLFLPEGYDSSDKKWPLILFLHGAGESGSDVEKVKATGLPKLLETKTDLPFVVVSPQSPRGAGTPIP